MKRILLVLLCIFIIGRFAAHASSVSEWAKVDVMTVFDSDIISDNYFSDYQKQITRQEYGYLMFQLYEHLTGEPISNIVDISKEYAFSDTSDLYLIALAGSELLSGYPDGTFKPGNAITREEIMVLYIRLLEKVGYNFEKSLYQFDDDKQISDWAYDSVKKCVALGIIKGKNGNLLDPKGNATIEESLVVLNRIMNHEAFKAAEQPSYVAGDAIVSNGSRTFAVSYDLIGHPVGIDEYRDFDFVEQVVSGPVGHRLCMSEGSLYYENEDGVLAVYNGPSIISTIHVKDKRWFVDGGVLNIVESQGTSRYNLDDGQLLGVTVGDIAALDIQNINGNLYNDNVLIGENIAKYQVSNNRIYMLSNNRHLSIYETDKERTIDIGAIEGTKIDVTGNYLVLYIPMHNDTTYIQFMPIFDIRRFTGN